LDFAASHREVIQRTTHHAVKMRVLQERKGREFSELVEELLAGWLNRPPRAPAA
jgi:hypothetical protein